MTDAIQVVCGHCDSVVRLPGERTKDAPRCPKCHFPLFEGKPIDLTEANFERHLTRGDLPLAVDFWAPWCGPLHCHGTLLRGNGAPARTEDSLRQAQHPG